VTVLISTENAAELRRARDLYATYCASSGGINHQGLPCPAWDELPESVRIHWYTVALRVTQLAVGLDVALHVGDEAEVEPSESVTAHLRDRAAAIAVWRRYSGIGIEGLADEMRRGVARFVSPTGAKP